LFHKKFLRGLKEFLRVNADHVTFDNYGGARESVQHLIGLGHERIGIISTTEDATSVNDRLQGYKDAMEEAFGSVDKSLIKHHVPGSDDVPQLAHELLRRGATAVFCVLSYIALDLYSVFSDRNLSIPDDVSIIGFGAGRETEVVVPRLSTVHLPTYEMGEKAAEVLFAKICDGVKEVRHVSVPAVFVEGGSTAAHKRTSIHL
jgi:LacI family transcriptional regulator